jgi:hypothetical protein
LAAALATSCAGAPQPRPGESTSAPQVQWDPIKTWSGSGSQYLESFPSEGSLRIEWEARRSANAATSGHLAVVMHSAISGRPLAGAVVDHKGEGKGTAFFSEEPRVFFANVLSEDVEWTITISERVR